MTEIDLRRVRLAWEAQSQSRRADIWRRAKARTRSGDRNRLMQQSRSRLAAWANDFASGRTGTPEDASWIDIDRLDARAAAVPAVLDAVAAIIAGDGLEIDDRSFLSAPFASGHRAPAADRPLRRRRPMRGRRRRAPADDTPV